jgi:Na+/H+ antiporter NhaC
LDPVNGNDERLEFRGGALMSVVPIAVFLIWTVYLVIRGAVVEQGMIIAAMTGIALGMLFVRDPAAYSERVFSLMANRIATVAVVCWIWAGAFSAILADSGLVEAMIWLGWKAGLSGAAFTLAVFISASLFAVTVGTGLGTVVGFTSVMYPAGIVLGAHPGALMGAILSGAAFGDNLAPVSDTTIVSAATQETDVGGVVRSRLKYSLTAGLVAAILLYLFGGGGHSSADSAEALKLLESTADPKALPMLIPAAMVFIFAVSGFHFLGALNIGIASAIIIGPLFGVFPLENVFHITADNSVAGSAVRGAMAMLPVSVLTLLLVTANGVMEAGGFLERVLRFLQNGIARTVRGAETAVAVLIGLANMFVPVNTIAMVAVGPLAARLGRPKNIHPYRIANLLDTISCSFPFLLPYAAVIIAAMAIQRELAETYSFVPVLTWAQMAPYIMYSMVLFVVMVVAIVTGFGRKRG